MVRTLLASFLISLVITPLLNPALAQTTTGGVRGRVTGTTGQPLVQATVATSHPESGVERSAVTGNDGSYRVLGLRPGRYTVTIRAIGHQAVARSVTVLTGQVLDLSVTLEESAVTLEEIEVVAAPAVEVKTSEMGTNITQEQIETLPQRDRNFLNFAGLAPGITVSRTENNKQITAGGLPATKINLFIDGASYKNDLLEGGIHGQDASRGNPFPQIAVQEFRVTTQNFKAEHQRAASAIISATTRSGTNTFEANGFVLGQYKSLVAFDPGAVLVCDERRAEMPPQPCDPKPEYRRYQVGGSLGGPLVRDRLHFFGGYEGNYQDREAIVTLGDPTLANRFGQYEGQFTQPFRSTLLFGKLTYASGENQSLDLSYSGRFESDKRGFGGTTSFESAENVKIHHNVLTLQHSMSRGVWFNQAHVSAQRSTWNPTVVNEEQDIGLNYENVIRIGARSGEQRFQQDRLALRNDLTYSGMTGHAIKGGANVDFLDYKLEKHFQGNPEFVFNPSVSLEVPIRASWGSGDPGVSEGNVQFGAFLQDDWDVTPRLQLNLGLRWDAETNQFNNKWVSPDSIRARLGSQLPVWADSADFFTDGREDRPTYLGAFQPRVGFSFDLAGNGRTILHGGLGIYYDREIWNHLIDERFRLQWIFRNFDFTTTGEANKIPWQDSYLSRAGLQSLVNQGNPSITSEVFLLDNNVKPPRTTQWSFGVRQLVSDFVFGAAYRGVRAYNMLSWYCGIPHSETGFCNGGVERGLPYSPVLASDEGRRWYDALDLTVEKRFSDQSRWAATFAYTYADARRKGDNFFTLSYPDVNPVDWPTVDQNTEKHHVVASGLVALPFDLRLSTLVQLGSGIPFNRNNEIVGFGPRRQQLCFACEDSPNFRQVDLRLEKGFQLARSRFGVSVEAINVLNHDNFREFETLFWAPNATMMNERFGRPNPSSADTGRRFEFGVTVGFGR